MLNGFFNSLFDKKIEEIESISFKKELAMGCCCEECETSPDCSSTVTFSITTCTRGPAPTVGSAVPIEVLEANLRCVNENCFVNQPVTTPCGNSINCDVCLTKISYVGCLSFIGNIPRPGQAVSTCFQGSQFIDQARCYTCANNCSTPCPPAGGFIASGPTAVITGVVAQGSLFVVTVQITLTLTNPCAAA